MPLKLSVERISPDGLCGTTRSHSMAIHNSNKAIQMIKTSSSFTNLFYPAGRFVSVCIMDNGQPLYCFIDFKKSSLDAINFGHKYFKDIEQFKLFVDVFEYVKNHYEEDYNAIELFLDESFGQTFIANN